MCKIGGENCKKTKLKWKFKKSNSDRESIWKRI